MFEVIITLVDGSRVSQGLVTEEAAVLARAWARDAGFPARIRDLAARGYECGGVAGQDDFAGLN